MSKLLEERGNQRFYKVDFDINFCDSLGGDVIKIEKAFEETYGEKRLYKFKEGVDKDKILKECKRLICVSDATTHTERLVFLAYEEKKGRYGRLHFRVAGKNTFMIDGGNSKDVYDDEVYIRYLRKLNKGKDGHK